MIRPAQKDDAFLADVKAARDDTASLHLWWLGQSGYLVQWQGRRLLLDPYLSDSLTKKYANSEKPHIRMTELIVDPRRLDFIDVVTSSHNHTDHLDAATLIPLFTVNPQITIVAPAANRPFVADRLKIVPDRITAIDDGKQTEACGFTIHAVPAAHETVERDEAGRCKFLGYVIQFGSWTIYHSGDTVLYEGIVERVSHWPIDVAMLPINGSRPERRVPGNLSGKQAAQLAHDLGARWVVPCHYDMFNFNTVSPDEFIAEAIRLGQPHRVLQCGERWTLAKENDPSGLLGGLGSF